MKEKELVTLRAKTLTKGGKSLFLDYSIDGVRYKDYLKMYLVPERTKLDRFQNEETMKIAQAAKAKKTLDLESGSAHIRRKSEKDVLLYDFIIQQAKDYAARGHDSYGLTLGKIAKWVQKYPKRASLRTVDKEYLMGFVSFLQKNDIADNTVHMYFANLNTIFNRAYRAGILDENPISRMDRTERPQRPDIEREYLTWDELQVLMKTDCGNEAVKRAFLFACFTGLRLSDIEGLAWDNIKPTSDGGWQVEERQIKTRKIVFIPLSKNAMDQLPERGKPKDRIWSALPSRSEVGRHLRNWVKAAGIEKHISFHCSRHTNATLLISFGADLYTVSSLLGHTDIATTQIYAKIVNEKKVQAVNLIPELK